MNLERLFPRIIFAAQMKLTYTLKRIDNVRIFLRHYYHAGWKWFRRLAGPIILAIGSVIYAQYDWRNHSLVYGVAAFVMGFGLYITLKPFFFILFKAKKFAEDEISIEITSRDKLRVTQGGVPADLDFKKLSSVQMMGKDMVLTFDSKASLWVLADRLMEGELTPFFEALKERIPKPPTS